MKLSITLINPNNVTQKGDFFGTGIPYMPIILAYVSSYLRDKGHNIHVIDAFGEGVFQKRVEDEFIIQGLSPKQIISKIKKDSSLICIHAGHVVEHDTIIRIIREIKKQLNIPLVVIENSQAVTSYSLLKSKEEFFNAGADFIIYGEPEFTLKELIDRIKKKSKSFSKITGLIYKEKGKIKINVGSAPLQKPDELPFPAWDLFPIKNYWKLGYAHAPFKGAYLPILSSRGCPYQCQFCIIPFTNQRMWRARSAKNVFEEMKYFVSRFGINEFHFEDLNPTIDKKRIEDLCRLIIKNKLDIKLKFASGIKIETIDKNTLKLLKRAGCKYISFSPESGSSKILKLMKKPFDYEYGIEMAREMRNLGIKSQACFVLGFPGEREEDLELTKGYVLKLTKAGIDEIALFIMTPIPGSEPYEMWEIKESLSKLTFSPKWRRGYKKLHSFRKEVYLLFLIYKSIYHPLKTLKHPFNLLFKNFETKMEMTLYRRLKI
jgi:radical SAM superfamily enzyme YgiQ (UPF0313 family)